MLSAQLARTEHRHRSSPVRDHSHHYDEADPGVSTVEEVGDMVEASVTCERNDAEAVQQMLAQGWKAGPLQ